MALPKIISVDDHVVEPAHVWQTWLPQRYRQRGPRIERKRWGDFVHQAGAKYEMNEDPNGLWGDAWYYEDRLIYVHKRFVAIPADAVSGEGASMALDRSKMPMTAITYDDMRPGCWDRDERIKDMTLNGVDGSLPFPTFPRFCGQTFSRGRGQGARSGLRSGLQRLDGGGVVRAVGGDEHPAVPDPPLGSGARRGRGRAQRAARRAGHLLQRTSDPTSACRASTRGTGTPCSRCATTPG